MAVHIEVVIARPPEDIFDFLADMTNAAAWEASLERIALSSGEAGSAGATYAYTRRAMGMSIESDVTVTHAARPTEIDFDGAWAGPVRPTGSYRLHEADGRTSLSVTLDPEVAWWMRPFSGMVRWMFAREFQQNAQTLKRLLEESEAP